MSFDYKSKRHFIYILRKYKRKTYDELLTSEYPITDLVTIEGETLNIEIILFEKHRDYLLLGLDVDFLESKKIFCGKSIGRTFAVYKNTGSARLGRRVKIHWKKFNNFLFSIIGITIYLFLISGIIGILSAIYYGINILWKLLK